VVVCRAADEFVTIVKFTDQAGGAEARNGFNRCPTEPKGVFYFHAANMTETVGHLLSMTKANKERKLAAGRSETNRGARLGDVDAFDLQHDFGERAMLIGGHIGWQDSGETAFNRIQ